MTFVTFRYMMLIQGDGEVFFLDRDNNVFQVKGLTFPHPQEPRILRDTLLDGVSLTKNNTIFL